MIGGVPRTLFILNMIAGTTAVLALHFLPMILLTFMVHRYLKYVASIDPLEDVTFRKRIKQGDYYDPWVRVSDNAGSVYLRPGRRPIGYGRGVLC